MSKKQTSEIVKVTLPREAPPERDLKFSEVLQGVINEAQFRVLCGKTPDYAIKTRDDNGFRYVPHGYVRDQLNKIAGFDWDFEIQSAFNGMPYTIAEQTVNGKLAQYLTVLGKLTLRLRDPKKPSEVLTTIVKTDFGSQAWRAKMELGDALKAAASDSLKRCGLALGIALDLYYNDDAALQKFEDAKQQQAQEAQQATDRAPQTLVELISKAQSKYGYDAQQLAAKLEVANIIEVKDFAAAWAKLGASNNGNPH